jgi:transcriptional regulator of acetoin/glycerol metabolism
MAYRDTELGMLVRLDPKRAALRIKVAFKRANGSATNAAILLGVDRRTLHRWRTRLSSVGA